jgi:hypothetical protein
MTTQLPHLRITENKSKNLVSAVCDCGKWDAYGPLKDRKMIESNAALHHQKHVERGK